MSHYLEHMLFMGSERFPDENDYDAYLQRHGGSANAYTEMVWCGPACCSLIFLLASRPRVILWLQAVLGGRVFRCVAKLR